MKAISSTQQPRSGWICGTILGWFILVTAASGIGQQPSNTDQVLHVTSRLVQLDVSVLDKNGNPVTDLQQSDFAVADGGQMQTIRTFETFADHAVSLSNRQVIRSTSDLQLMAPNASVTILVLDELNTEFADNAFARSSIRKYLLAQPAALREPTSLMVATDSGFQQASDVTTDRQQLIQALDNIRPGYPFGLMRTSDSPEGRATRFAQTLASLQQIAQATLGLKGRKNIIWVGRGFASLDLRNEPDHQAELVKGAAERAVNLLQQAHVTVYTVDPTLSTHVAAQLNVDVTGSDPDAFLTEAHNSKDPFADTISFNTIAPQTGGRAFSLNNDIDQEIASSVAQGSAFYTISYVPTANVDPKNTYRQILVHVDRPGMTVVTRRGYFTETPPPQPVSARQAQKAQGFDIGTAISSNMTFTGLGVFALPSSESQGEYVVQVSTRDIAWTTQPDGVNSARLTLVAVALNDKGSPVQRAAKEITARFGAEVSMGSIPFATLRISVPPDTRARRVRLVVRDEQSGKLGTSDISLNLNHR